MIGYRPWPVMKFCWLYITPTVCLVSEIEIFFLLVFCFGFFFLIHFTFAFAHKPNSFMFGFSLLQSCKRWVWTMEVDESFLTVSLGLTGHTCEVSVWKDRDSLEGQENRYILQKKYCLLLRYADSEEEKESCCH